jgi:FSR family fosmidomycin resistance protein-like MFS transporter
VFILLTAFRSWAQMNFIAFLPKYYSDLGYPPKLYGPLSALLMGGSALGGVIGGWLGDRFPKRWIVVSSLLFSTPLMLLFMPFGSSAFAAPLVLSIGFFVGASHSILVVLAQDMLPGGMGMASGLILGFTFASGSLGTLISGAQADRFGFNSVFLTSAVLALVAAVFARALPLERKPDLA